MTSGPPDAGTLALGRNDKAVEWLPGVRAQDAAKPWFMYYSTGCAHAPHHVARAWADKYRGRFDGGWDKLRDETFERQKRLGVIPADAELTRRPVACSSVRPRVVKRRKCRFLPSAASGSARSPPEVEA